MAEWLLALGIRNADERDMILGDLQEQAHHHGGTWHLRESTAIAFHALARRFRAPAEPKSSGDLFMQTLLKDVRYGWRGLWKRPILTLTVVGTLALGLGANAAIFNLIDRLVLRPFPFADPDTVVMLAETGPGMEFAKESVSPANFLDWRAQADSLTDLSGLAWWDANLLDRNDPERVQGFLVSAGYFDALGVRPALGRGFVHDDETYGRHHVVVLSDTIVAAPLRRRSGDRRTQHHAGWPAVPSDRRRAAAVQLPRRRVVVGAARLRSEDRTET